jgi:hypothetical protein
VPEPTALQDWAASGAMTLTGRPNGPPLAAPGRPASQVREELSRLATATRERIGATPRLPGVSVLGERAAAAGFRRNGPWSCGGSFRALRTIDGFVGLSLARPEDLSLVPALVEVEAEDDPWAAVASWAAGCRTADAVDRAELLGLPCCAVPSSTGPERKPVQTTHGGRRRIRERPRVLDLSALWAGPLCAHLLGLTGCEVTKVESTTRLDGARSGPRSFFDLLHAGHRMVTLDFSDDSDLSALRSLVLDSDVVLEASRPRALRQLGILAEDVVEAGTSWVSITARGRGRNVVGFGDDVAAGAGLFVRDGDEVLPCGDALADPLTGVAAAAAAAASLLEERAKLIDVSMYDVARAAAQGPTEPHEVSREDERWWVECEGRRFPVAEPAARKPSGTAGEPGADNGEVLR